MFGLMPFSNNKRVGLSTGMGNSLDFARVFDEFFNDSSFPSFFQKESGIKVDVIDEGEQYVMEAELPTVNKEDVAIDVSENVLTISVNKNEETNKEDKNKYIYRERKAYAISRSFNVENIKIEGIDAKFNEGILTINLPKKENAKEVKRVIDIQ